VAAVRETDVFALEWFTSSFSSFSRMGRDIEIYRTQNMLSAFGRQIGVGCSAPAGRRQLASSGRRHALVA
jgi:hypothetical protein